MSNKVQSQLSVKTTSNIYIYNQNAHIYERFYETFLDFVTTFRFHETLFLVLSCYSFHNLKTVGSTSGAKFCQFADCAKGSNCKLGSNQQQWVNIHSEIP